MKLGPNIWAQRRGLDLKAGGQKPPDALQDRVPGAPETRAEFLPQPLPAVGRPPGGCGLSPRKVDGMKAGLPRPPQPHCFPNRFRCRILLGLGIVVRAGPFPRPEMKSGTSFVAESGL